MRGVVQIPGTVRTKRGPMYLMSSTTGTVLWGNRFEPGFLRDILSPLTNPLSVNFCGKLAGCWGTNHLGIPRHRGWWDVEDEDEIEDRIDAMYVQFANEFVRLVPFNGVGHVKDVRTAVIRKTRTPHARSRRKGWKIAEVYVAKDWKVNGAFIEDWNTDRRDARSCAHKRGHETLEQPKCMKY